MKRALKAGDAGRLIAETLGLPEPLSAQVMWRLAREKQIEVFRIGRSIWFTQEAIIAFIAKGGTASAGSTTVIFEEDASRNRKGEVGAR